MELYYHCTLLPVLRLFACFGGYDFRDLRHLNAREARRGTLRHGIAVEPQLSESLPAGLTLTLLNLFEAPLLVANLSGALLLVNEHARQALDLPEDAEWKHSNLFGDIRRMDPQVLLVQIESGESEVDLHLETASGRVRVRLERLPNSEWLVLRLEPAGHVQAITAGRAPPAHRPRLLQ